METLSKDTKIYDDTGKENNFTLLKNGDCSVGQSNGVVSNSPNTSEYNFENPVFVEDNYEHVQTQTSDLDAKITKNGSIKNIQQNSEISSSFNESAATSSVEIDNRSHLRYLAVTGRRKNPENTKRCSDTNSTPTKPYVSTIIIERPKRSPEATYKNIPLSCHADLQKDDFASILKNMNEGETLDSDSGFPYEKESQDEEEPSSALENKIEDELSSLSSGGGDILAEPEPDYSKLVRFDKSHEIVGGNDPSMNTDNEDYDPSAFYFLESAATAL